jgi:hypothetical protein
MAVLVYPSLALLHAFPRRGSDLIGRDQRKRSQEFIDP